MNRATELREMFDVLKSHLPAAEGSAAAAIAREMRILSAELETLELPVEQSKVDELAARRKSGADVARPSARRRKSG